MESTAVNRRAFIRGASGAALLTAAGAVAACGSDDSPETPGGSQASSGGVPAGGSTAPSTAGGASSAAPSDGPGTSSAPSGGALPSYFPIEGVEPDLAPTKDGVQAGYFSTPSQDELVSSGIDKPGGGINATWLGVGSSGAQIPLSKNRFWQELNKRLDAKLDFNFPPQAAQYKAKLATALAGGTLGDFTTVYPRSPTHLLDVLEAKFEDLTPHLSGDAIKKYANLANIPSTVWQNCIFRGKIFAVPSASPVIGPALYLTQGVRDSKIPPPEQLKDGSDLFALFKELTNSKTNEWAMTAPGAVTTMFAQMCGAPNLWGIADGKFTYQFETDEWKRAIGLTKKMWDAGYIFPDAFTSTVSSYRMIPTGQAPLVYAAGQQPLAAVSTFRPDAPELSFSMVRLPKYDGGGWARQHLGRGVLAMTALKKADEKRIGHLLAIADWIAAPFGTTQYEFKTYGIPGHDSTMTDGVRGLTKVGSNEIKPLAVTQLARPVIPLAKPGATPDDQRKVWEFEKAVMPDAVPFPTSGLYSDTDSEKGPALNKKLNDVQNDIIQGRKPLSAWDSAVKDWAKNGGDQIRKEYEASYAAAQP